MDCTNKMTTFSLKTLLKCYFFRGKLYFLLVHLIFENYSGIFCLFIIIILLHYEMTLLSFKTKNHLIMNNGLFKHFNETI